MGKSERGPDMLDCSQYIAAMEEACVCSISVLLESGGYAGGSSLYIGVIAVSRTLTPTGPEWSIATRHLWPHRDHKTFEGCLYCALAKIDADLAQRSFNQAVGV